MNGTTFGGKSLVEKLRSYDSTSGYSRVMRLAADEIERLRAALVEIEHQTHSMRVWGGQSYTYHPPQSGKIAYVARAALDKAAMNKNAYAALNWDVARCTGSDSHVICAVRNECRRYTERENVGQCTYSVEPMDNSNLQSGCELFIPEPHH